MSRAGRRPSHHATRDELVQTVMWRGRRLSTVSLLYSQAVADRVGLNLTDLHCLGILAGAGPLTAGQLGTLIGLTSGAITGLVDRLERQGLVRRERDREDRRRVVIHLVRERDDEIGPAVLPMLARMRSIHEHFTDEELALIARWLDEAVQVMRESLLELRSKEGDRG